MKHQKVRSNLACGIAAGIPDYRLQAATRQRNSKFIYSAPLVLNYRLDVTPEALPQANNRRTFGALLTISLVANEKKDRIYSIRSAVMIDTPKDEPQL